MQEAVLALKAGSSSVKFGLYDLGLSAKPDLVARGALESGDPPRLAAKAADGTPLCDLRLSADVSHSTGLGEVLHWIEEELGGRRLVAAGHRIVHGGRDFADPVPLTSPVIEALDALTPLAPLHQPRSLAPIHILAELKPDLLQVGCFDTAFHRTIAPPASRFALPRRFEAQGIRRYGFHGISYEYISGQLSEMGITGKRTIVAHLGNGASLCAIRDGRSVDTTMGFSALDGLVMGTRCGALDPGILLYLLLEKDMAPEEIQRMLYEDSGLLGVSGLSGDMRTLEASDDPHAAEAIDLFVFRAAREVAALANTMGGLDCLVFTAGIGERSAPVRKAICERLRWLGVEIDSPANDTHAAVLNRHDAPVEIHMIPADEEVVIARHTLNVMQSGSRRG